MAVSGFLKGLRWAVHHPEEAHPPSAHLYVLRSRHLSHRPGLRELLHLGRR